MPRITIIVPFICMLQIIDALSHDKLTLKEQLERANERIKELEQENQSKF